MFFAVFFIAIIAAPTVIISMDDNVDVTFFFGENEEEEKDFTLVFKISEADTENQDLAKSNKKKDRYTFKSYPKPYLDFISPPPEIG
ncbi:hypothetical protein GCM10011444_03760 [Winogradskyella haliclonae]|uniref:Uncharacterized protein n=2 Tax=Winogradskyella haliclonae TaxID=2048558 RepID=A0ABQ2BWX7_9FLAO|nr:hypothetical protein GCM10011444_03760 [Winogradskyella haliclonae]